MARRKNNTRLGSLILANLLIPVSILLFATGFFPYKPFLSGLATFEEAENGEHGSGLLSETTRPERVFDKVVFMVVDALRSDFVYGHGSGFEFTQSLIRTGAALPFTAHAAPPTVTMPRVKGLTSGSVPSFLDLILNFAESDTTSSLATQDTWLAQIKAHLKPEGAEQGNLVFYGDDTWLKLFPHFFHRADGTSSFFVSDFTEVDDNVTRHVPWELEQHDWNAMIMHYLGLDHIGHKSGPLSPNMLPKQREMDGIVETIYDAMYSLPHLENTLLVLAGDHGMNAGGNHGGSAAGETSPALVFISPKLREITCDAVEGEWYEYAAQTAESELFTAEDRQWFAKSSPRRRQTYTEAEPADKVIYEPSLSLDKQQKKLVCASEVAYQAPTQPKVGTEFEYYRKVEQSDLVPTLAALLGVPVSKNNLGIIIPEMLKFWTRTKTEGKLRQDQQLLYRNALQVLTILKAAYGDEAFDVASSDVSDTDLGAATRLCNDLPEGADQLSCKWHLVKRTVTSSTVDESVLLDFLSTAQETLSAAASSYNVTNLVAGSAVAILATIFAISSKKTLSQPTVAGVVFTAIVILYGVMMFATSYVEEEQHFWYWITSAWILCLYFTRPALPANASSTEPSSTVDVQHSSNLRAAIATFVLLAAHRLTTRWNQTGQKFAGAPDIAHHYFPAHHIVLWVLILMTYFHMSIRIARRTFSNLASPELAALTAVSLTLPSLIFKLNFTQADAPELVQGLAEQIREITARLNLVLQARATFLGLAIGAVAIVLLMWLRRKWLDEGDSTRIVSLPQRLHDILTLFLMTQTRAQNIPLFLIFEIQLQILYSLLSYPEPEPESPTPSDSAIVNKSAPATTAHSPPAPKPHPCPPILPATLTILLMTHTSHFALSNSNAISSLDLSNAYNGISTYNVLAVGILLFCSNWAGPIWWGGAGVLILLRLRDGDVEIEYGDSLGKSVTKEEREAIAKEEKAKERRRWVERERAWLAESTSLPLPSAVSVVPATSLPSTSTSPQVKRGEAEKTDLWPQHVATLTIFTTASLAAVMIACTLLRTHLFIWTVFSPKFLYAMAWALAWHGGVNLGVGGLMFWLGGM